MPSIKRRHQRAREQAFSQSETPESEDREESDEVEDSNTQFSSPTSRLMH